jgi:hypothetical protein
MSRRVPIELLKKNPRDGRKGGRLANTNAVKHGAYGDLSKRNLDQRSKLARALREVEGELVDAVGGDPSPQEKILIDRVVFKLARVTLFEAETLTGGNGADEHYLAWSNSIRLDLQAIGLKRAPKPVPSLQEFLAERRAQGEAAQDVTA